MTEEAFARGRTGIKAAMATGASVFLAMFATSILNAAGIGGILTGFFVALFDGLMVAVGLSAAILWWLKRQSHPAGDDGSGDPLAAPLRPVLAELEAARSAVVEQVVQRALWRVPLGMAAAVLFLIVFPNRRHSDDLFGTLGLIFLGGFLGYIWASTKLSESYRRLYKQRVLPSLAQRYGAITWRAATPPDMKRLEQEHIFRDFDDVTAEDELVGTYRGLPISIVELRLTAGSGDRRRLVFDGLLVELVLQRLLAGTTAVIADAGVYGNFRDWLKRSARDRIRLEDPRFESIYQVWGTDQIAARALLSPAFMERMLALAERPGFDPPLVLARDDRLTVAMPKTRGRNLFEPPSYLQPATGSKVLVDLDKDVAAVLATADVVIDFDALTRDAASSANLSQPLPKNADGSEKMNDQ